ncbi:MAG: DUF642 domain-containing protein [Chthoniobacteraceae bacterium]
MTTLYGQFGTGYLTVTDWTTSGYNFVFVPGTADVGSQANGAANHQPKESPGQYNAGNGYGNTYLWGSNNGGTQTITAPPNGSNFLALDGDSSLSGKVSQTITGLTVGQLYSVSFSWAAAQQESFTGTTSESIAVSLGGSTATTGTFDLASKSFSGWMQDTVYFTATGTSETLSFLAVGTPNGEPPFSLLANVDMEIVPDSSNWMVFAGFGMFCIVFKVVRRRRRESGFEPDCGTA